MKVLILCGGLGERLRPFTETVPKVMLQVNGRPILEYIVERLKNSGIVDIVLLCGYKHEVIENHFGDGKKLGVKIQYSVEKEKSGTGGAVKNASKFIDGDFVLINGDVLTNFPIKELIEAFKKTGKNIMSLVKPYNPFGVAKIKSVDGRIAGIENFVEKPKMNEWINAGYIILKKSTVKLFPQKGEAEKSVYPVLQRQNDLLGYLIEDKYFWKSIDTTKDLKEVNAGVS